MNSQIHLMTHVVAGFPSMQQVEQKVLMMASKGVKYKELSISRFNFHFRSQLPMVLFWHSAIKLLLKMVLPQSSALN